MTFLYNGVLIDEGSSFAFSRIENWDTIVALPESSEPGRQVDRWKQSSRDSERLNSLVNSMMNLTTRRESMRLRDPSLMKKELGRKGRLVNTAPQEMPMSSIARQTATVATAKADQLSTQPLPVLW
jgi:hypothetical protein